MTPAEAGCIGKHRFDNKSMAGQVARKFGQRHHGAHCVYRCAECGGWHIGNQLPGSKAAKRKQYAAKKSVDQVCAPDVNHAHGAGFD